mgnify:CR=1 FL=1
MAKKELFDTSKLNDSFIVYDGVVNFENEKIDINNKINLINKKMQSGFEVDNYIFFTEKEIFNNIWNYYILFSINCN